MEELSCPICFESYDFKLHRPLLLPECGHTFCKACLQSKQQCPDDRSTIRPGKLPTNMLALRSIEFRGERIPGVAGQVKLIRSGELELQDKVGEGGSGEVWRACYHHKMVAVKVFKVTLPPGTPGNTQATPAAAAATTTSSSSSKQSDPDNTAGCSLHHSLMRAFVKEVQLLQLVSEESMYCCRLVGCALKDSRPCIVMKWFGNGHLQVPQGGLDLASALQWGVAIAKALADVHALGILVADLKPENILISDQGDPVLADFGISRQVTGTLATLTQGRTASSTCQGIQGTPFYMAPEQWQEVKLTNRADIWAWGCLMLQLLTGRPPWLGLTIHQVMCKLCVQQAMPPLPPGLPCWLSALLQSCFCHEPSGRPSAAELVAAMKASTTLMAASGRQEHGNGVATASNSSDVHARSYDPTRLTADSQAVSVSTSLSSTSEATTTTQAVLARMQLLYPEDTTVQGLAQELQPGGQHRALLAAAPPPAAPAAAAAACKTPAEAASGRAAKGFIEGHPGSTCSCVHHPEPGDHRYALQPYTPAEAVAAVQPVPLSRAVRMKRGKRGGDSASDWRAAAVAAAAAAAADAVCDIKNRPRVPAQPGSRGAGACFQVPAWMDGYH